MDGFTPAPVACPPDVCDSTTPHPADFWYNSIEDYGFNCDVNPDGGAICSFL